MKKTITRIIIAALIVFIIYNLITLGSAPETTSIAQSGTVEITADFDGIISRAEQYVTLDMEEGGVLDLSVSENEMVKKGKMLGVYYDSSIDESKKKRLSEINRKISEINSSPTDVGAMELEPKKLDAQIQQKVADIISAAPSRNIGDITSLKEEVTMLMGRKLTSGGDTKTAAETLESLRMEKIQIEREYGGKKTEVISPLHGVFSTHVDGYETILTPEKAVAMTVSDFNAVKDKDISSKDAVSGGVVCKIMDNSKWWVSVLADEKSAGMFKVGTPAKLRFAGESKDISANVEYISGKDGGKYIITFSSDAYSEYALTSRQVAVTVVKGSYSGLKIPLEAIRVKDGKAGVYVRTENTVRYRETEVLYKDEDIAIVKVDNTKTGALLLYDEVIVNYKGE